MNKAYGTSPNCAKVRIDFLLIEYHGSVVEQIGVVSMPEWEVSKLPEEERDPRFFSDWWPLREYIDRVPQVRRRICLG